MVQGGPPLSTAPPTVIGTARRTSTLSSTAGSWSGIGNDFTYQWQRRAPAGSFVNIAGATGETYTLVSADVGFEIRLRVTATNPEGAVSANSAATAVVVHAPPANSAAPSISGPARLGGTLTAATGTWSPADVSFTYAWQRDGVDIPGATGATYTLVSADVGKLVRVRVTGANVDGSASAYSAAADRIAAPPANTVTPPAPSGTPRESETLTAASGTWDTPGATISIAWVRCAADGTNCTEVGTGSTYTLSDADVGRRLGVRVTASSSGGTTTVAGALSAVVTRLTLANVAVPSVTGNAYEGATLTADAGRWTFPSPALEYAWQRCDANAQCFMVSAASQYTLTEYDVDHTIVLFVTARTPGQSATAQATPLAIQARPVPAFRRAADRHRHGQARPHAASVERDVDQQSRPLRLPVAARRRGHRRRDREHLRARQGRRGLHGDRRRHGGQRRGDGVPRRRRRPLRSPPPRRSTPTRRSSPAPTR